MPLALPHPAAPVVARPSAQAFDAAVKAAIDFSKKPPEDFFEDVMALLAESKLES